MSYLLYKRKYIYFKSHEQKVIRECEKKGNLWYTKRWWSEDENGIFKPRRSKKYVSGIKLIRELTYDEVCESLFICSL